MNAQTETLRNNLARAANPFGAPVSAERAGVGSALVESQAAASIQSMVVMAKRFPRDPRASVERILDACTRPSLAESAEYAYPRGGETVTGPSIRLAEVVAQNWGNLDFGIVELSQEGGRSQVMAYAWDLETNVREQKIFMVEHVRKARGNLNVLTDPRDVYELIANQGARRLRACILGIIPGDVIETAVGQCRLTLHNSMNAPADEIAAMVAAFEENFNIPPAAIRKRLGKKFEAVTAAEVIRMRQIFASLRDGMSKPGDWFDITARDENGAQDPEGGQETASKPVKSSHATNKLKGKIAEKTEAPTATTPPPKPDKKTKPANLGPIVTPAGLIDSAGELFDPASHVVDENAEPVMNDDNTFKRRPQKPIDHADPEIEGGQGDLEV